MPEAEEIKADLFDPADQDNQRVANLFDDGKWQQLILEYNNGAGRPLDELIAELLERR